MEMNHKHPSGFGEDFVRGLHLRYLMVSLAVSFVLASAVILGVLFILSTARN